MSGLFFFSNVSSQSIFKPGYTEFDFQIGKVIENHPVFPEVNAPSVIAGIRVGNKLNGTKNWHDNYRYPDVGVNFIFGSLGNKDVLGNIAAFLPEISFRQKLSEKWSISETAGLGISYFNKPYEQVSNPENSIIGSHITFCASAAVNFEYRLKKNISLISRACIYHSSNAHTALPNVGLNVPLIGIGIRYLPRDEPAIVKRDSAFKFDKKIHFNARLGLGINEQGSSTAPTNGPKYPIYITSLFITKNITPVNKLQAGIEGWYNTGVYDYITSQDFYAENQKINSMALVFFVGHEFLFGHFSLVAQGGIYIHNPFYKEKLKRGSNESPMAKLKTIFPARLGYQYYLFDATVKHRHNLFIGVYIKTNLGQADFLDTGIGYTF